MPFSTLLNYTLLAAVVLLFARSLLRAFRHRKPTTEPTCPRCHYVVLGLVTPTCPECGANLRTTGILPPQKRRLHFMPALLYSLVLLTAATLMTFLFRTLIVHHIVENACILSGDPPGNPEIILLLRGDSFLPSPHPDELEIFAAGPPARTGAASTFNVGHNRTVTLPDGPLATLTYSAITTEWTLSLPNDTFRTNTLTTGQIAQCLSAIGATADTDAIDELTQLFNRAKNASTVESFNTDHLLHWHSDGKSTSLSTAPSGLLLALNAWLFAFLWSLTTPRILLPRPLPVPFSATFPMSSR